MIWGIPLYHDDALRAVQTAQRIQQMIGQHHLHANIGISTGEVICHRLKNHHHFTIIGTNSDFFHEKSQAHYWL